MSHRINFSQLIYFDQIPSLQGRSFDANKADMGPQVLPDANLSHDGKHEGLIHEDLLGQ